MNPQDELNALTGLFSNEKPLIERAEHIPSALLPEPFHKLLVHDQHMTVTMEAHYGGRVEVQIIDRRLDDDVYSRKILLLKSGTDKVVQFGIVRFNFRYVTQAVRDEILAGEIPMGHVLIKHNVLRHIYLGAVLRITAGPALAESLQLQPGEITYGRLATIFCNQLPAVDLLEIPSPLD